MATREIKFRAWDKKRKIILDVGRIEWTKRLSIDEVWCAGDMGSLLREDADLMQYTGLKDMKGKEIYEGDIVKSNLCSSIGVIGWDNEVGSWFYLWQDGIKTYPRENYDVLDEEVIGNIYENPEIMERAK